MANKLRQIRYRTVPKWFVPFFFDLYWSAGLSTFFLLLALSGHTQPLQYEWQLLWLFVAATLVSGFFSMIGAQTSLSLCQSSFTLPLNFLPDMQFRLARSWHEVASIGLEPDSQSTTFDDALQELKRRPLYIHFKTGGHARLHLDCLSDRDLSSLLRAFMLWCKPAVNPEVVDLCRALMELESAPLPEEQAAESPSASFTRMWEQELSEHFATTTFVPLDKGQTLQEGRYEIAAQLAAGGMAAVYKATTWDSRKVVLKEANLPAKTDDKIRQKARELFEREAQILRKLDHPNVARVFDHFVERGRDYLVLEYIPGATLRQLVRQGGAMEESCAIAYARRIAEILAYLHSQDPPIIHRDLTPDNLVVRPDGKLVLIDFGAANEFVSNATGTLIGKQSYISPEQFRGKATPASDIYALGATIHFLLTGEEPEALTQSRPRTICSELSAQVDDFVADCTALDLQTRINSAETVLSRLEFNRAPLRTRTISGEVPVVSLALPCERELA